MQVARLLCGEVLVLQRQGGLRFKPTYLLADQLISNGHIYRDLPFPLMIQLLEGPEALLYLVAFGFSKSQVSIGTGAKTVGPTLNLANERRRLT